MWSTWATRDRNVSQENTGHEPELNREGEHAGKKRRAVAGGTTKGNGHKSTEYWRGSGQRGYSFFFFFFFLSFSFSRDSLARLVVVVVRYDTGIREDGWGYVGRLCERMEQVLKSE